MRSIMKRSGVTEEFSADKIDNSMRNAGISQETARRVAASIEYHEGISTSEIRNRVIGGIENRAPDAARRYGAHAKQNHKT